MDNADNMKVCPQCGEKISNASKFCAHCGYAFPAEETPASSKEDVTVSKEEETTTPGKEENTPSPETENREQAQEMVDEEPAMENSGQQEQAQGATPVQPMSGGFQQAQGATPVQPMNGSYQQPMSGAYQSMGGMQNPAQPMSGTYQPMGGMQPQVQQPKKGKGGLIAILSIIGVLVLAGVVLIAGMLFGWFGGKKIIELSDTKVTVEVDDEIDVKVTNYSDIGKPDLIVESSDESIATVSVKNGTITVTGIEEGKVTITVSARGCEEVTFKVTVEEAEPEPVVVAPSASDLYGTAWEADNEEFYLLDNGTIYMIYEDLENYIKGSYSVTATDKDGVDDYTGSASISNDVSSIFSEGNYYIVEVDVDVEMFYGSESSGGTYYLIIYTDGSKCAIYDSGWEYTGSGSSISMKSTSELESYFDAASQGSSGSSIGTGVVPGINFGTAPNVKESWHATIYEDVVLFKHDGDIYGIRMDDLGTGAEPLQLTDVEHGFQITIMAVYGDYLFYGIGEEGTNYADTSAFCKVDLKTDEATLLSDDISIKDFVIYNNYIYYTDYSELYRMDFDGNTELLWEYGVFTFEIADDYIFIFDGYEWEVIDPEDGYDYGYIVMDVNGAYESDLVRWEDETLFFTAYNYDESYIYLYAMDYDGNMIQIGDGMWGETYDTYNAVFDGQYVIYTVGGGETFVRTNVTTGEQETRALSDSDSDLYYVTEMFMLDGKIFMYGYDYSGDAHYLLMDDDLTVSDVLEMN